MNGVEFTYGKEQRVLSNLRLSGCEVWIDVSLDGTFIRSILAYRGSEETAKAIFHGGKKLTPGSKLALEAQYSFNP